MSALPNESNILHIPIPTLRLNEDTESLIRSMDERLARIEALLAAQPALAPLLKYEQVAELLGLELPTVKQLVYDGALPVIYVTPRAPRIEPAAVAQYIAERRVTS